MNALSHLTVKIFADGADLRSMLEMYGRPYIAGLTTNPTLMHKAGIVDYRSFAKDVLAEVRTKPVCFEVLADDFVEMERQALEMAGWGSNVFVKIPVTNTRGTPCAALVKKLTDQRVQINVTALMTLEQLRGIVPALNPDVPSFVSIFAGRIADTGIDPVPIMKSAVQMLKRHSNAQLVWASSREIINIFQADAIGCGAITLTDDILKKLALLGCDLTEYSLQTVRMFYDDARRAGLSL
jgi:transaldolase